MKSAASMEGAIFIFCLFNLFYLFFYFMEQGLRLHMYSAMLLIICIFNELSLLDMLSFCFRLFYREYTHLINQEAAFVFIYGGPKLLFLPWGRFPRLTIEAHQLNISIFWPPLFYSTLLTTKSIPVPRGTNSPIAGNCSITVSGRTLSSIR